MNVHSLNELFARLYTHSELKAWFDRICAGANYRNERFNFEAVFASKKTNAAGLQVADLAAYPITHYVRDENTTRPDWASVRHRIRHSYSGQIRGWGLKVFVTICHDLHRAFVLQHALLELAPIGVAIFAGRAGQHIYNVRHRERGRNTKLSQPIDMRQIEPDGDRPADFVLLFWGVFVYDDVFGETHRTYFKGTAGGSLALEPGIPTIIGLERRLNTYRNGNHAD